MTWLLNAFRTLALRLSRTLARLGGETPVLRPRVDLDGKPQEASVRIRLDRPRTLRFTLRESAEFKRRTGLSLFRDSINLLELDEDQFIELLTVACLEDDPTVRAEQLAPHVAGERVTEALAALMIVLHEFRPPLPTELSEEDPWVQGALHHLNRQRNDAARPEAASPGPGADGKPR